MFCYPSGSTLLALKSVSPIFLLTYYSLPLSLPFFLSSFCLRRFFHHCFLNLSVILITLSITLPTIACSSIFLLASSVSVHPGSCPPLSAALLPSIPYRLPRCDHSSLRGRFRSDYIVDCAT